MIQTKTTKNGTALQTLRSWLKAVGIPNKSSEVTGSDLTITTEMGGTLEVAVTVGEVNVPNGILEVAAAELTCNNRSANLPDDVTPFQVAMAAFHRVTRAAGYGTPSPLNRGAEPDSKLCYKDEDFLVAIRATEFRRSPNPSSDQWDYYGKILKSTTRTAMYLYYDIFARNGYDYNDLLQLARCWQVNFCGRYERATEGQENENKKLFTKYLKQRFVELVGILHKKERSVFPDMEAVSAGLYENEQAVYLTRKTDQGTGEYGDVYLPSKDDSDPEAAMDLAARLETLGHEGMLAALNKVLRESNDVDVRKAASKHLKSHKSSCGECRGHFKKTNTRLADMGEQDKNNS